MNEPAPGFARLLTAVGIAFTAILFRPSVTLAETSGMQLAQSGSAQVQPGQPAAQQAPDDTTPLEAVTLAADDDFVVINVEVARTPEQREKGLMNRDELPEARGMLFVWDQPLPVTMWMRNTKISLDMIFIRSDGVIHRIAANTVPFSEDLISSHGDVLAVLEVRGGLSRKIGLRPGHRVHHAIFGNGR
ncbi:DUF192 domain-containing protein [Rhodoligotrophos ferricapiens]|uniref:DUF192 domain-containing protein n=1 Tax=Rhodoligotrophos ferricapiens TaxID=3069264 RepID=UPI00315C8340